MLQGYSICLVFLKLFERIYGPRTAGLLDGISANARLHSRLRSQLNHDDLEELFRPIGLNAA
jgi:hypothetical protein